MLLKCLHCGARLALERDRCACLACSASWPVVGDIPRFFQSPDYYWGEVGRDEARQLLAAAREGGWAAAVRARFPEGDNMYYGLLDPQRASWLPWLGLDEKSVALDLGCGYGAITHSISHSVGEVYSVEAIPERIEFTQERLRQEGIGNVRLVQASALSLPLIDGSFDLIIVNGILEWVGEWQREGNPRDVQVGFLATLRGLLKENGVLVIGIENRIGYGLFLGGSDHSGIAYTSLVPRFVATFLLRRSSKPHHRTTLNPKREYRTYTYSEGGYRRLLSDAGFAGVSCYWADPGYNQPYHLIPTAVPQMVREHFCDSLEHPGIAPRVSWRRRLKMGLAACPWLTRVVPEFILIATKQNRRATGLDEWLKERVGMAVSAGGSDFSQVSTAWALYTHPFARKSVVRLVDAENGRDLAYVKAEAGNRGDHGPLQAEVSRLVQVRERIRHSALEQVDVPELLGMRPAGALTYAVESPARGMKFSRMVRRFGYFSDWRRVEADFRLIVERLIGLTEVLQRLGDLDSVAPEWREFPQELSVTPDQAGKMKDYRYFSTSADSPKGWVQHGDLTVENVFLDLQTGRIEIIDWDDLAAGWPPLYDFFSFFYSTAYLTPGDERRRFRSEEERWVATFEGVFLKEGEFSRLVQDFMGAAGERLGIPPERLPALLVEFLIVRTHYYRGRSPVQHRVHLQLLRECLETGERAFFGRFGAPIQRK